MTAPLYGAVVRTERLAPRLVRVVLGGKGLSGFVMKPFTDTYVNAQFLRPGSALNVPFDDENVRTLPREERPAGRRCTVSSWDPVRGELALDFVVHGDQGIAGPWAQAARPGDLLQLRGPSGDYAPDPEADVHLLVGDESALPAIAASLAVLDAGAQVHAVLEVDGPADELPLTSRGDLVLRWVHRADEPDDLGLLRAVAALDQPVGRVQAFVHGEAVATRAVRTLLLRDWGVARDDLSCSPYWRRTFTDEAWREVKPAWQAAVETDVPPIA